MRWRQFVTSLNFSVDMWREHRLLCPPSSPGGHEATQVYTPLDSQYYKEKQKISMTITSFSSMQSNSIPLSFVL